MGEQGSNDDSESLMWSLMWSSGSPRLVGNSTICSSSWEADSGPAPTLSSVIDSVIGTQFNDGDT